MPVQALGDRTGEMPAGSGDSCSLKFTGDGWVIAPGRGGSAGTFSRALCRARGAWSDGWFWDPLGSGPGERVRDRGVVGLPGCALVLVDGFGLVEGEGGIELAAFDLFGRRTVEAELADGEALVCNLEGRAEGAAEDGTGDVEVAGLGGGVEGGAGGFVVEVVEGLRGGLGFEEVAGGGVEQVVEAEGGCLCALADVAGSVGVGVGELGEAVAEAVGVEGGDGEGSVAALGAAGAAGEPEAGAAGGVGEGGVDDLEEGFDGDCPGFVQGAAFRRESDGELCGFLRCLRKNPPMT